MALPVRLHPKALEEAEAAVSWYRERSHLRHSGSSTSWTWQIGQLANNPSGYAPFEGTTRRILLTRFPYMLIFRERATWVEVIAIAHRRRRPGYWRERLNLRNNHQQGPD